LSKESIADSVHYSDWRALLGFMDEQDGLRYIHATPVKSVTTDEEWLQRIRSARDYVASIHGRAKSKPELLELPSKYADYLTKLQGTAPFQESVVGGSSFRFASVEISKLRCLQGHINLEYLDTLIERAPSPEDEEGTLRFCLPLTDESERMEVLSSASTGSNSLFLVSPNLNFRVAGMANGQDPVNGRRFTAVIYGFGSPHIAVAEYRGAYIVMNGHHRALSLLRKGHKMVPGVVATVESYPQTGPRPAELLSPEMVMSDRPALLPDFDSRAAIAVPRRRQRVVINVHAEAQSVPF